MREPAHQVSAWMLMVIVVLVTAAMSFVFVLTATASARNSGSGVEPRGGGARLTDDDRGVASLELLAMVPGSSTEGCVEVTYFGDPTGLPPVRVYGASSGALVKHLWLSVGHGSVGATCRSPGQVAVVYEGPLADFGDDFASGVEARRPVVSDQVVPYVFEVRLDEFTPNSAQAARADFDLMWEVRPAGTPH